MVLSIVLLWPGDGDLGLHFDRRHNGGDPFVYLERQLMLALGGMSLLAAVLCAVPTEHAREARDAAAGPRRACCCCWC
jgi:hypothetical protein